MKILVLISLLAFIKPCTAQDSLLITPQLLKPLLSPIIISERADTSPNFVISYLRAVNHKTAGGNFLYPRQPKGKAPLMSCCQLSKHFLVIDKAWLRYHFNAESTDQKASKISSIAGELMDTFLMQYSIQNKRL